MGLRTPTDPTQDLPEYAKQKQLAKQQLGAQAQTQTDALNRRLASIGNLKSGAAIKQNENLANDTANQTQTALGSIDAAQAAEIQRRNEVQQGQDFTAAQNLAGQNFTAGQNKMNQDYGSVEAQKARDASASENAITRKIQQDQFGQQFGLQNQEFGATQKQNEFQNAMATDEATQNKYTTQQNSAQAYSTATPGVSVAQAWEKLFPGQAPAAFVADAAAKRVADNTAHNKKIQNNTSFANGIPGYNAPKIGSMI